ncbi:MAG: immunoglobulin domain-containing protein [Clostridiales bacterium]|nr:immunoglobulin domain-containing protein [Clostridiales bacterium]
MNYDHFFPIERNRYFYGKLLTVRDFEVEQRYNCSKRELLNRVLQGAGVVCGFGVSASDDSTLMIESGFALDYQGREIVLPETIFRKLQMLEGQETLLGKENAYLCVAYDETAIEPVNAVGNEAGESRQFNMTREGYRLFLTTEAPEYQGLLEAAGRENVSVLYSSDDLTLALSVPSAVCAGGEFQVQILVVKNANTPPVIFTLEGESAFVDSDNGRVLLSYHESREEQRQVYTVDFRLKCRALSDVTSQLFPTGAELNLELGNHKYKNYLTVDTSVYLCRNQEGVEARRRSLDNLEHHLMGRDIPIYLAKLTLLNSAGGVFLGGVTNLPFHQTTQRDTAAPGQSGGEMTVTTSVRSLEYWQKPDVRAVYQSGDQSLHFDFGIPSPEQYDYTIAHGTVDLTMPGGIRVNSRVYSEEIAHGLGPGAVDIRLSVEFLAENREQALLYGNREVFKAKNSGIAPPWVEAAAVVYPGRGTMRVGLWLHDTVDGNRIRVHYFAQKPERDTSRILSQRQVSLTVTPEFSRLARRGTQRFQAEVIGSEDKTVSWSIREENGGAIDRNGIYQAPELAGTYEIVAVANADETVTASAFVIVE